MSALLTTIIQAVLGSLVNGVLSYLKQRRQERALQDAAKLEVINEHQKEALDARDRLDAVRRRGRRDIIDGLRDGSF